MRRLVATPVVATTRLRRPPSGWEMTPGVSHLAATWTKLPLRKGDALAGDKYLSVAAIVDRWLRDGEAVSLPRHRFAWIKSEDTLNSGGGDPLIRCDLIE